MCFYREVTDRNPEEFKIDRSVWQLFPGDHHNPYHARFGNKPSVSG